MGKINIGLERNNYNKNSNDNKNSSDNKNNNDVKQQNKLEKIKQIKAQKSKKKKKIIIILLSIIIAAVMVTGIVLLIQSIPEDWSFFTTQNDQNEEQTNKDETKQEKTKEEEKQRKDAIKAALAKFKELGENIKEKDLKVLRIQREGKKYYYISSPENTVEVSIETNQVVRLNGVIINN